MNLDADQHHPSSMANTWDHIEDKDINASHHHNMSRPPSPTELGMPENMVSSNARQAQYDQSHSPTVTSNIRDTLPAWKWNALLISNCYLTAVHGYDVSNVANVQPSIYKAFGHIEVLPWVALSYSVSSIALVPFSRKLLNIGDFKTLYLVSIILMLAGTAISGAAPNLACVIAGRVVMALGTSVVYQGMLSFNILLCYPRELGLVTGSIGACFAVGLVLGPIIGGVFAATEQTTWRWAFYLVIPLCVISLILQALFLPRYVRLNEKSGKSNIRDYDFFGNILHVGVCLLFPVSCTLLGSTGVSGVTSVIAVWVSFTFIILAYVIQQGYSIGTTPDNRLISPLSLLGNRTVLLTWICTICAAAAYGAALYYVPIYFAFNRGLGPLDAATRLLPFICIFIFTIMLCGALLPVCRIYKPFFVLGSIFLLGGGGLFHTLSTETPESSMMGFEVLVAAGLGMLWQLAVPVCSTFLPTTRDRLDLALLSNMAQLGGIAVSLSIAGMIYQGTGFQSLKEAFGNGDVRFWFSDEEIRELLAGVDSPILRSGNSTVVRPIVMNAITDATRSCFTIILAAGGLSFLAAMSMKWEALEFKSGRELSSGELGLGSHLNQRYDAHIPLRELATQGAGSHIAAGTYNQR
ncbi:MFS general substrate transporter [Annulohypoxylon bovei var. microspora]|nr:MFS general substrate transporter [Annulohypoxylon bovei var. microspora]